MTTTQHTCFTAHCDECKDNYENGDGVTLHYDTAEEAIAEAEGCDWQQITDGRLVCDRCVRDLLASGEIEENPDDEDDAFAYRPVTALAAPTTA